MNAHINSRFDFSYILREPLNKERMRKNRAANNAADLRHVRRTENRYLQDREELKRGESYGGMGLHFPSQDAFAIETQGAIQDRTREHLGSTDIVIIGVRKALFNAIKKVQEGGAAPWVHRNPNQNAFADFVC